MAGLVRRGAPAVVGFWMLAFAAAATAAQDCRRNPVQPEDIDLDEPRQQLARDPALELPEASVVRNVTIHRRPIFDTSSPGGDNAVYRLVNWLNLATWESALASQLVFAEGEALEPGMLRESERILRDKAYLTGAWVSPTRVCGDEVDVAVLVRDTWTLYPSIGISRSGGENSTTLGLSDPNFLGSGKFVSVSRNRDPDRTETSLRYRDPNVLGSRWRAALAYDDRSDGMGRQLSLERPFYSERARWSFGVEGETDRREDSLFFGGDRVSRFERETDRFALHYGRALASRGDTRTRLLGGYRYRAEAFAPVPGRTPPTPFPEDRTLSYPWVGIDWREERFHETTNLTRIRRVEDVRDGIELRGEIGYSAEALGGDADRLVVAGRFSDALLADSRRFADYRISQTGHYRLDEGRTENLELSLRTRYFDGGIERWTGWYAMLEATAAHNLTADRQLTIGGDSGLRGYPRHYQTGNRRVLATLERRYFPDWHPFELFRVGGVVFADVGRAWFDDGRANGPDEGVLADVGAGLRLASNRFEVNRMLHLDLAFPVTGDDSIGGFQVLLRGRNRF